MPPPLPPLTLKPSPTGGVIGSLLHQLLMPPIHHMQSRPTISIVRIRLTSRGVRPEGGGSSPVLQLRRRARGLVSPVPPTPHLPCGRRGASGALPDPPKRITPAPPVKSNTANGRGWNSVMTGNAPSPSGLQPQGLQPQGLQPPTTRSTAGPPPLTGTQSGRQIFPGLRPTGPMPGQLKPLLRRSMRYEEQIITVFEFLSIHG
ncbi:unnamed protein product [Leptidea sinapis]|uniref:Uncharacterized protein n=1 Tax=Leptidea sinapis TaxID=189913 RepID=A0A5E4PMD2_9NEOP|nr:unnamed protein product [Leptidea sinapis]